MVIVDISRLSWKPSESTFFTSLIASVVLVIKFPPYAVGFGSMVKTAERDREYSPMDLKKSTAISSAISWDISSGTILFLGDPKTRFTAPMHAAKSTAAFIQPRSPFLESIESNRLKPVVPKSNACIETTRMPFDANSLFLFVICSFSTSYGCEKNLAGAISRPSKPNVFMRA